MRSLNRASVLVALAGVVAMTVSADAVFAQATQQPAQEEKPRVRRPGSDFDRSKLRGISAGDAAKDGAAPRAVSPRSPGDYGVGDIVRRDPQRSRDLILNISVQIEAHNPRSKEVVKDPAGKAVIRNRKTPIAFDTISVLFPYVLSTAGSELLGEPDPTDWAVGADAALAYQGRLTINDRVVDTKPELLTDYAAGTGLARWDFAPGGTVTSVDELNLLVHVPVRCARTTWDEQAAMAIGWPSAWPKDAESALKPQLFVEQGVSAEGKIEDYDPAPIEAALKAYLAEEGIKDPKSVRPAVLAKLLAAKVWRDVQVSGDGLLRRSASGRLSGVTVRPPAMTLEEGRGSEFDVVAALTALYREAGLPARTVVGIDVGDGDSKFLSTARDSRKLRAWVEFALVNEQEKQINWVPVDVVRLRRMTQRPMDLDQSWRYFGAHEELDSVLPFALQFHPPTDVAAYSDSAAFWGWFVTPSTPEIAGQTLSFTVSSVANRGEGPAQTTREAGEKDKRPARTNK